MKSTQTEISEILNKDHSRRKVLTWSTPVIVGCVLPAHGSVSCPASLNPPIFSVGVDPKCSGDPPVGTAEFRLTPADGIPIVIKSITAESDDPKNLITIFETLPREIAPGEWQSIFWVGPAGDGVSCFPLTTITIVVEYCCPGGEVFTATYDVLTELVF